jgi:hypothetical protein
VLRVVGADVEGDRDDEVADEADRGGDQIGEDAAGLVLALFYGMLFQELLDPTLAIEGDRMEQAQVRLRGILPTPPNDHHDA